MKMLIKEDNVLKNWKKMIDNILERIFDILFPQRCIYCKKVGKLICENCLKKRNLKYFFRKTPDDIFDYVFCGSFYQGEIKKKMHLFKFHEKAYLYKAFIEMSLREDKYCHFWKKFDVITYVPMYYKKEWERGYNQSFLLAKELGKRLNMEVIHSLEKMIENKVQSSLSEKERKQNVENVFQIKETNKVEINNKNVILVDDILTTGATARACSKVLKKNGAKKILVFTIAKT